jgi:hypothetical protein
MIACGTAVTPNFRQGYDTTTTTPKREQTRKQRSLPLVESYD